MAYETGRATRASPARVASRDDFASFVEVVLGDFEVGGGATEWQNATLADFLDGLTMFAEARVVGVEGQEEPSWRLFAEMIVAATGYE